MWYKKTLVIIILLIITISFLTFADEQKAILDIRIDKLVYSKYEDVKIKLTLKNTSQNSGDFTIKVKIFKNMEVALDKTVSLNLKNGEEKKIEFIYKPDKEFGYYVLAEVYENNKLIQEKESFFEVLSDWTKAIRMGTGLGGLTLRFSLTPDTPDLKLVEMAESFKNLGINVVQFYDIVPNYGVLTTKNEIYLTPRDYPKPYPTRIKISKEKIKKLISELRKRGIKVILYDELGANDENGFRKDFAIYQPLIIPDNLKDKQFSLSMYYDFNTRFSKKGEPIRLYGGYPYDGNPYMMMEYYADQLYKAIKEFGWDGIFHDSIIWLFEASAFGTTYEGKRLNLSPDEIGEIFITTIDNRIKKIKPDFVHIANGGIFPSGRDNTYPKARRLFKVWTVEFPNGQGNYIKKMSHIYPQTFDELAKFFSKKECNLVIYQPFFDIRKDINYKRLLAVTFSHGIGIYHRPDHIGYEKYNRFASVYGEYLFNEDITNTDFNVKTEPNVFTVVKQNKLKREVYIHLINLQGQGFIWETQSFNIIRNLKLVIDNLDVKRAFLISPDDEMQPVELKILKDGELKYVIIPELKIWDMILLKVK